MYRGKRKYGIYVYLFLNFPVNLKLPLKLLLKKLSKMPKHGINI